MAYVNDALQDPDVQLLLAYLYSVSQELTLLQAKQYVQTVPPARPLLMVHPYVLHALMGSGCLTPEEVIATSQI